MLGPGSSPEQSTAEHPDVARARFDHRDCFVCGPDHPDGLRLRYAPAGQGALTAEVPVSPALQSYPDRLHGGIIAMILDDAMTNCLLRRGVPAVTGRLNVTFRRPADLTTPGRVQAWLVSESASLCRMRAEFRQGDLLIARAEAKFVPAPEAPAGEPENGV